MFYIKKYPYLIAEVGGNHSGNFALAKKSILNAKNAGADCVKFQWYNAKNNRSSQYESYESC